MTQAQVIPWPVKLAGPNQRAQYLRAFLARRASGLLVWQADPHFSLFQGGVVHNYPNKLASTTRQVPILWLRHINFPPLERPERRVCATRLTTTKDAVYSSLILCIFSNLFAVSKKGRFTFNLLLQCTKQMFSRL